MSEFRQRMIVSGCLVIGAVLGLAGTFAQPSLRGLAWGVDGVALIVASALLAVHYFRKGNDAATGGFLVFMVGETLLLSGVALDPSASTSSFGAGVALWAASLLLIGLSRAMPLWIVVVGLVASILFAIVALEIFFGRPVTALSQPLPFFAYPLLVATLIGWAWVHYKDAT